MEQLRARRRQAGAGFLRPSCCKRAARLLEYVYMGSLFKRYQGPLSKALLIKSLGDGLIGARETIWRRYETFLRSCSGSLFDFRYIPSLSHIGAPRFYLNLVSGTTPS